MVSLLISRWRQNLAVCCLEKQKEELQRTSFQDNARRSWMDRTFLFAVCCGISVPESFLFCITWHLLSDRGFKLAEFSKIAPHVVKSISFSL